ncbi:MAG: DUF6442 family protein [Defluviitaleaceae bacterium]|nr:DUF6442 family protein [Defluviitaleaceae bacterium]
MSNPTEKGNGNRREEILEKSRRSNNDEGIEYAVNKGIKLGNYYTEAIGTPLILLCIFTGQMLTVYALFALYGANCFGDFLAKYRYFKQKRYMMGTIIFGVLFGGYFAFLFVRDTGVLQGWWG